MSEHEGKELGIGITALFLDDKYKPKNPVDYGVSLTMGLIAIPILLLFALCYLFWGLAMLGKWFQQEFITVGDKRP